MTFENFVIDTINASSNDITSHAKTFLTVSIPTAERTVSELAREQEKLARAENKIPASEASLKERKIELRKLHSPSLAFWSRLSPIALEHNWLICTKY